MASYAVLLLLASTPAFGRVRGSWKSAQNSELMTDMRPEVVSKLLNQVEHKWTEASVMVMRNKTDSAAAYAAMESSCVKVTRSIIDGSDGDEDRVSEYMKEVCAKSVSEEDKKECQAFAAGVEECMSGDASYNRERLDLPKFCKSFWSNTVHAAATELKAKEDADAEATAAKKAADEKAAAEKKAADEKAEAERKEAEAKAAAEKKAADEKAAAEKKAADEKAAAEEKAANEKAAAEKKEVDDKASAEKKEKEEQAARQQMEEQVKAASIAKEKVQNLTAAIMKGVDDESAKMDSAVSEARNLSSHARTALRAAVRKEAQAKAAAQPAANSTVAQNATAPAKNNSVVLKNVSSADLPKGLVATKACSTGPGYRNAWDDCGGAGASATERMRSIAASIKGFKHDPRPFKRNAAQDAGKIDPSGMKPGPGEKQVFPHQGVYKAATDGLLTSRDAVEKFGTR